MKNVLIFFGGKSCEHDVSVITGVMTANRVDGSGYNAVPVYVDGKGVWYSGDRLKDLSWYKTEDKKQVKRVFLTGGDDRLYSIRGSRIKPIAEVYCALNCMHGLNGEDGSVAGAVKLSGIPFASPGIYPSAVSMDKHFTKLALSAIDVKTLPYVRLRRENYFKKRDFARRFIEKSLGYPVIVKPADLGSSIGISVAEDGEKLFDALDTAFRYDGKIIAERALKGYREINCACYRAGGKYFVSECEEPTASGDILSFSDKYVSPTDKKFPADIPEELSDEIRSVTEKVYRKLEFTGVIRIDYLYADGELYLNEINSVPGSLAYYLFCKDNEEFGKMLERLIEEGVSEYKRYASNDFTYVGASGFLTGVKGGKRGN